MYPSVGQIGWAYTGNAGGPTCTEIPTEICAEAVDAIVKSPNAKKTAGRSVRMKVSLRIANSSRSRFCRVRILKRRELRQTLARSRFLTLSNTARRGRFRFFLAEFPGGAKAAISKIIRARDEAGALPKVVLPHLINTHKALQISGLLIRPKNLFGGQCAAGIAT